MVNNNLNQELNDHLLSLTQAAAKTTEIVKHEYFEQNRGTDKEKLDVVDLPLNLQQLMAHYEKNRIIDFPFNNSPNHQQGIEWFDEKQTLIVKEGNFFPDWSLSENLDQSNLIVQKGNMRSFALPVFYLSGKGTKEIAGYIRATESTHPLEAELTRLYWGLNLGGFLALGLTALGGMWLTKESLKPVEKSFQQLKQFTADASHELRNPLTAIKTSVSIMQSHPERIHPADVKKIDAIASASNQMNRLVEDLLILARMDGVKTFPTEKIPIPLEEILEDLLENAEIEAMKKNIVLKADIFCNVFVKGDALQLQRLFANLIDNALHYTPDGGKLIVTLHRDKTFAIITVEDTGIGIAFEDIPHVFERLWRASPARSYYEGGTGLGMAIAQSIAQAHGGNITLTSQVGVGSCFQVKLPIINRQN